MEEDRVIDEKFDHAAIAQANATAFAAIMGALQEYLKEGNDLRYRATLANYVAYQIAQLQKTHAEGLTQIQLALLDLYEFSADRRYRAAFMRRLATLNMSAQRDAVRAAEGALAEMEGVRDAIDELRHRQVFEAVVSRLPLFELIAGSRRDGLRATIRVLQVVAPAAAARLVEAAQARGSDVPT